MGSPGRDRQVVELPAGELERPRVDMAATAIIAQASRNTVAQPSRHCSAAAGNSPRGLRLPKHPQHAAQRLTGWTNGQCLVAEPHLSPGTAADA